MKEFAVYTAARLSLFVLSYVVVAGVFVLVTDRQVPVFWLLLVAVVISSVASVYLLRRQRENLAAVVQRRAERASARFEEMRSKEDHPED